jgi:hypothetical protein
MHGFMNIMQFQPFIQGAEVKPDEFEVKIKYTIFLHKFITKIIFISKHFNYNIHFLNMPVRWRPLLSTHSPKRFWKLCVTR